MSFQEEWRAWSTQHRQDHQPAAGKDWSSSWEEETFTDIQGAAQIERWVSDANWCCAVAHRRVGRSGWTGPPSYFKGQGLNSSSRTVLGHFTAQIPEWNKGRGIQTQPADGSRWGNPSQGQELGPPRLHSAAPQKPVLDLNTQDWKHPPVCNQESGLGPVAKADKRRWHIARQGCIPFPVISVYKESVMWNRGN